MKDSICSIVIGRNDNYGGNLHHRAILCLNNLINNFDEVIYVDWVSPGSSLISDIKKDLINLGKLTVIEVSQEDVALNSPQYEKYLIVEPIAKNIGLRRASSNWILQTNIDILLKKPNLNNYSNSVMYTCGRRNVPESQHLNYRSSDDLLNDLLTNKSNWPKAQNTVGYKEDGTPIPLWDAGDIWSLVLGPGDFQFAHRDVWNKIKGFEESLGGRFYADSNILKKSSVYFGYENIRRAEEDVFHMDHESHPGQRKIIDSEKILPMNDQAFAVRNFQKTQNPENWGWSDFNLKSYIV
jgi:hypothetical protein